MSVLKAEYKWSIKQVSDEELTSEMKTVSSALQQKLQKLLNILDLFLSYKGLSNENRNICH